MVHHRGEECIGFFRLSRLSSFFINVHWILFSPCALLNLVLTATPAQSQNILVLLEPDYSTCGNVSINGAVDTDPPTLGLVWDWGDGAKTTSWFPATHRYAANGTFTVTVTAAGCDTLTETTTAQVTNAGSPGCPPAGFQAYYHLVPYSMHLTVGTTSTVPLRVVDQDGIAVSGTLAFTKSDPQDLVSILAGGYVEAEREENTAEEAGVWVNATIDGNPVSNSCVMRVLPAEYAIPGFAEAAGERTALYYPTTANGYDIAALVARYEIPTVNEHAYRIQNRLMGTSPFQGGRQIFEVDLGITETNRVCGISGNPIRLGWNTGGDPWNPWQNCFLVPFPVWNPPPPLSPQWGVFYHELGHNMTWASFVFATGLGGHYVYSEGLASAMGLAVMEEILGDPVKYPIENDAFLSLKWIYNRDAASFTAAMEKWLSDGGEFAAMSPDIVDGIWLFHKAGVPHFAERFFLPLQPLLIEYLGEVLCQIQAGDDDKKHTFFAALVSAAAGTDLSSMFTVSYHFPIDQDLFSTAYTACAGIILQRECPGDFDKDGRSDSEDLALFAADFGKSSCAGECEGDFNTDGDVDGSELATFILKFGRTDCL